MAGEIVITAKMVVTKSPLPALSRGSSTPYSVDMAGSVFMANIQNVGFAAEEALNLGDVIGGKLLGMCWMKNLDPTNYFELRPATGVADCLKFKPGEEFVFRFATDAVPFVLANTAAVNIAYLLYEA